MQTNKNINLVLPQITLSLSFDKKVNRNQLYTIDSPQSSADLLREIFSKDTFDWTEEFIMLCLNRANKVIGYYKVSSGGMAGTVADQRVIFTIALNCAAHSIIVAHNHPSGALKASQNDDIQTEKIVQSGKILDIKVLDHIILTDSGYYSFAEDGKI